MKKTAVLLYDTCCLFELTVALQMLSMAGKDLVYFGTSFEPIPKLLRPGSGYTVH